MSYGFNGQQISIINQYMDWLNYRDLPLVVVSGDEGVSIAMIDTVVFELKNFLKSFLLEFADPKLKINMKIMPDYNSNNINRDLMHNAYHRMGFAQEDYGRPFSDDIRRCFQAVMSYYDATKGYTPRLNIVITSKPLDGAWGVTYPSLILLYSRMSENYSGDQNNTWSKLIIHEFCHALGVNYPNNFGGNCSDSSCLMSTNLGSINLCKECKILINSNLLVLNQDKPGKKFLSRA